MVSIPTVVVEADWGRTGLYDHAQSNITADVLALSTERGRDYASQLIGRSVAGKASIDLVNTTGKYSRSNAAGALYGVLDAGVLVRVRVTAPAAATLWTGFLSLVEASSGEMVPGEARVARLTAVGPLARLRALGTVNVVPQTTILTGDALALVLDAAGWSATARRLDAGQTELPRWWVEKLNALSASADLEETERGFLSEGADGAIVYEDRHHRLKTTHLTSQATFSDAPGATLPYTRFIPRDTDAEIFNTAVIPVRHFTTQALAVLWTYRGDTLTIAAGASLELWTEYPGASVPDGRYVDAWTTPVVGTDITQTGVADGDLAVVADKFSQSMKITITNNHATAVATLTLVQARGTAVTEDEPTIVKSEDTASSDPDTGYGERTVPRVGAWHQSLELTQAIADFMVSRYSAPLTPIPIGLSYEATRSAALMTEALTRNLSDHITVVANDADGVALGVSGDYYVEAIRISITKSRTRMDVFYDLSPVSGDGGYWAIGEVGYSELGETTRLAPP